MICDSTSSGKGNLWTTPTRHVVEQIMKKEMSVSLDNTYTARGRTNNEKRNVSISGQHLHGM
jgi:hypothetical protein